MIELGLSRVFQLLARTPLPWRAIHVAGTNGKGSICAYVSSMLSAYNNSQLRLESGQPPLKHGRFTSPHLIDRWDCITINETTISESIFNEVEARVLERNRAENIQASEFEILTATAFEIFTQEHIHVGVIEVGMGGRLDATNILGQLSQYDAADALGLPVDVFRPKPLVTAISTIALDHQGFLGNTVIDISNEKAGIIKRGVPVVLAPNEVSVMDNIARIASETGATELVRDFDSEQDTPAVPDGAHARKQNGGVALAITKLALEQLHRTQTSSSKALQVLFTTMKQIPTTFVWPGRIQNISIECVTGYKGQAVLDGAHNKESAEILANTVHPAAGKAAIIWVIAASKGKDIQEMLQVLLSDRNQDKVIAVEFGPVAGMPWVRPMALQDIAAASSAPVFHAKSIEAALHEATKHATITDTSDPLVVIAGSLYLVGDVLRLIRSRGGKID
ncbi:hypothetical protein MBLNU459_g6187t1 [Dothideomycetes sp. NU459]